MTETQMHDAGQAAAAPAEGITLTPAAIDHVKNQIRDAGGTAGLRVGIVKSGCSGWAYLVDLVQEPAEDDMAFPMDDELTIYVDPKSYAAVRGTQIDYIRDGISKRLHFENPNVTSACGCGESFSVS